LKLQSIYIEELNCKIFRCGIYKNNFEQIDPHLNKEECDRLYNNGLIYGCSKPFMVNITIKNDNNVDYESVICDYI
jgi:hypothetical protein